MDIKTELKDHLTALPVELQYIIIGYLFPDHKPDKAIVDVPGPAQSSKWYRTPHDLDALAFTSKPLRAGVMTWARRWLLGHRDITKYKASAKPKTEWKKDFLRGPKGLLKWASKHCIFCGKSSVRTAIMMNGFRCCRTCDDEQWPDKITKTDAIRKYPVREDHLLPHKQSNGPMLAKHPGLPRLRYGTYMCFGVATTIFMKSDVEALAELRRGGLEAHLAKRQADREERKRKQDKRDEEPLRKRLAANFLYDRAARKAEKEHKRKFIMQCKHSRPLAFSNPEDESGTDPTMLDGNEGDRARVVSIANTTNDEDRAAVGPAALRGASLATPGVPNDGYGDIGTPHAGLDFGLTGTSDDPLSFQSMFMEWRDDDDNESFAL